MTESIKDDSPFCLTRALSSCSWFVTQVQGVGCRVQGLGFSVWGSGYPVVGLHSLGRAFEVCGLKFMVWGLGVWGKN